MQGSSSMGGGQTVAPGNQAPKRDARGIPVISAPAQSPAGFNQPPGTPGAAPASSPAPSQGNAGPLPPCSRRVTDNCTQTYERHHGDTTTAAADTGAAAGDNATADSGTSTTTTTTRHHRRHRAHRK
jgi:hypothetical protein